MAYRDDHTHRNTQTGLTVNARRVTPEFIATGAGGDRSEWPYYAAAIEERKRGVDFMVFAGSDSAAGFWAHADIGDYLVTGNRERYKYGAHEFSYLFEPLPQSKNGKANNANVHD